MARETETVSITVKKVFHNEGKDGKKESWTVYAGDDSYRVWDSMLASQLTEGTQAAVSTTSSNWQGKIYHNIVGMASAAMQPAPAGNPFLTDNEETNLAVMTQPSQPSAPVVPKLTNEVGIVISERIAAYEAATRLVANGVIEITEIVRYADRALDYYHGTTKTDIPKAYPNTDINPEDYLR